MTGVHAAPAILSRAAARDAARATEDAHFRAGAALAKAARMDRLLRRTLILVPAIAVMVCSALLASAANHLVAAAMIVEPRPRASAAPPKAKPAPTHSKDIDELVARNMFCSDCEARTDVPAAAAPPPALATLTLIATMRDDSGWSATISNPTTARAGSYRVGEVVPDVGPVRRIGPQSIDVENVAVARVERVHLFPPAPSAAAPPPPGDPRVRRVADNRFEVDRAVVDEMLSNPMAARGSARVFPAVENGRPVGFRVSNLRGSSVLSKMGLEDGDQVRAVNGYTLDSPDHALEAYSKLRDAKQFQVAVLRRGRPVNLEYTIR